MAKISPARLLQASFPEITSVNVSLRSISRWKVGGNADVIVEPRNITELQRVRSFIRSHSLRSIIIGETSNLLFADEGLRAVGLKLGNGFCYIDVEGQSITVGGGTWVPHLARTAMKESLSGLEHTCGIPGTVGGLVYMNGGSQRRGIGDNITSVKSVSTSGQVVSRTVDECAFAYRTSVFHHLDEIIAEVELHLSEGTPKSEIRKTMLTILKSRRAKFPRKLPNCGSVFVSDPAMYEDYGPPGKIIEELGFKGFKIGGAEISPLHANFINNSGGATAGDILTLIDHVREKVQKTTGKRMRVEARYVSPYGAVKEI